MCSIVHSQRYGAGASYACWARSQGPYDGRNYFQSVRQAFMSQINDTMICDIL
jgi:hypothetical protein